MTANPTPPASTPATKTRRLGRGLASLMSNTLEAPPELSPPVPASPPSVIQDSRYVATDPKQTHGNHDGTIQLAIGAIRPNPYQPRRNFEAAELEELSASISRQGVLQPLLVAKSSENGDYTLIAGERRLRAAKKAGLTAVPCIVRTATREQMVEWALVENVQRQDLNAVELARAYREYLDRFGASQQDLAEHIGQPRSTVANYLRLLDLSEPVLSLVLRNESVLRPCQSACRPGRTGPETRAIG